MRNSDDSVPAFQRLSAQAWISKLNNALDKHTPKRLKRLNKLHNSIRSWDLGKGATTGNTGSSGWRLLP